MPDNPSDADPDRRSRARARNCSCSTTSSSRYPPGDVGDLYIGGVGPEPRLLARRGEDPAAFVERSARTTVRSRLYRTGDLARMSHDGLGVLPRARRLADQEPRPPDRARRDRGGARSARHAGGIRGRRRRERRLRGRRRSAAPTCRSPAPASSRPCSSASCRALVPGYMLPSRWRQLEALPKNANGKIDRPKLRELFRESLRA